MSVAAAPVLLVAVDNSASCRTMFTWLLQHRVQTQDTVHILHVALRDARSAEGDALPATDYFEQAHPIAARQVVSDMLQMLFVAPLQQAFPGINVQVHIVQASQDSKTVARIICEKAEQLHATEVFMGGSHMHTKGPHLFSSSPVVHVKDCCKVPVTVIVQDGGQVTAQGQHTAATAAGGQHIAEQQRPDAV